MTAGVCGKLKGHFLVGGGLRQMVYCRSVLFLNQKDIEKDGVIHNYIIFKMMFFFFDA